MPVAKPSICVCTAVDAAVLQMSELLTTTLGALAVLGVLLVTTVEETVFVSAPRTLLDKQTTNNVINIKVRSTGRLLKAKINLLENSANVEILDKETGISPGQACVFYSKDNFGDKVLGGGWIHKTHNKNLSN